MAVIINRLITGSMGVSNSAPAYHADTWYKYAGDTEWRTVSITGAISGSGSTPTTQIPDAANVIELEIGSDVTSVGSYAFYYYIDLTSVTIPDSVTSIGDNAFYGCNRLTNITIGDNVTYIGNDAFYECIGLTSVTIPDSVTYIGDSAFLFTDNMQTITFENKTKSQVQAMQNYHWDTDEYTNTDYYYPTITFVCSDGNIILNKYPGDGGSN